MYPNKLDFDFDTFAQTIAEIFRQFSPNFSPYPSLNHTPTRQGECSKDDRQSLFEMSKFDTQPTLNPSSDRHQIWTTWLLLRRLPPNKFWDQSAQGFCPHIPNILNMAASQLEN